MPKDEAMNLGAMALFGEKYGETVRVVTIDPSYSVELCGGTHVGSTGELGFCIVVSESGVAAGVRRIEAVCGYPAEQKIGQQQALIKEVSSLFKNPRDLVRAIEQQGEEFASVKKQLEQVESRLIGFLKAELVAKSETIGSIHFIGQLIEASSSDALKKLCNELRSLNPNSVVVLAANINGKPNAAVGIADALVTANGLDAIEIIKHHVAGLIKGGGGGQKALATAGGQDVSGLQQSIAAVKSFIATGNK